MSASSFRRKRTGPILRSAQAKFAVILVDTSVWIDHLRRSDESLQQLLVRGQVLGHPLVIGELAVGNLKQRNVVLQDLQDLPQAIVATEYEVRTFIDEFHLFGQGIGYIDAHLLAAVRLTPDARLWTRDKRLNSIAISLSLSKDYIHSAKVLELGNL